MSLYLHSQLKKWKGELGLKMKVQKLWQFLQKCYLMYSIIYPSFTGTKVFMGSRIFSEYIVKKKWNNDTTNKICLEKSRVSFLLLVKKHLFDKWGAFRELTIACTPERRRRLGGRLPGDNGASQMRKHDETAENLHAVLLLPFALIKPGLLCLLRNAAL